jgi:hypothetical protein
MSPLSIFRVAPGRRAELGHPFERPVYVQRGEHGFPQTIKPEGHKAEYSSNDAEPTPIQGRSMERPRWSGKCSTRSLRPQAKPLFEMRQTYMMEDSGQPPIPVGIDEGIVVELRIETIDSLDRFGLARAQILVRVEAPAPFE